MLFFKTKVVQTHYFLRIYENQKQSKQQNHLVENREVCNLRNNNKSKKLKVENIDNE